MVASGGRLVGAAPARVPRVTRETEEERFTVRDKVVIVTGAAGGIGSALAGGFAAAGATVLATGRTAASIEDTAERLGRAGRPVTPVTLDVTDADAFAALVEEVMGEHGRLDVLVNNAGVKSGETILEGDLDAWEQTVAINAWPVLRLSRLALPHMPAGSGSIVNIGSSVSSRAAVLNYQAGGADYCLSKAMVHSITQLLAYEAAARGVVVNAVAPGIVDTPMHGRPREETESRHAGRIPLDRIGDPEDFVGPALFLASPAARYLTGQILHVNGGMLMEP